LSAFQKINYIGNIFRVLYGLMHKFEDQE